MDTILELLGGGILFAIVLPLLVIFWFVAVLACLYTTQRWAYKTGREVQEIRRMLDERPPSA